MIRIWVSPFGDIKLPDDFPTHIFRKDGWWDMRYTKIRERWEAWVADEEQKLQQLF